MPKFFRLLREIRENIVDLLYEYVILLIQTPMGSL